MSTITVDTKAGRKYWGRSPLPQGALLCGTVGTQALLWLPTGWWCGGGGVLSSLDQREAQRGWLQALRDLRGWELLPDGVSPRTWEGWEGGRNIPAHHLYALWTSLQD